MTAASLTPCRVCRVAQPVSNFEVCKRIGERVYRRKTCSACKVDAQRARRVQLRQWVDGVKKTLACVRCGFSDYRALQFHHRDGETKDFNIGDMVRLGISVEVIKQEMAKCYVLCANCHHIEHHNSMANADIDE